jgi:Glycosyltransferase family 87
MVAGLLCLLGLTVNGVIIGPGALRGAIQGQNDFRQFYVGAKLARTGHLYDLDRVLEVQREVVGESNARLVPGRLPFYYAALGPLASLPYREALLVWDVSTVLAAILFIWLSRQVNRALLAVACCWSLPLVFSTAIGQDVAFVLLLLVLTLRALDAQRPVLAGMILSLCLIKFHVFLLLPLLFLGRRDWRLASGFSLGAATLLLISFVAGWDWPQAYIALNLKALSEDSRLMPTLHGLAAHFPASSVVEFVLSVAVLGLVWRIVRRAEFEIALAAVLLGGLLLTRHAYMQDCGMLVGSLVTLFERAGNSLIRYGSLVLLLPIPYVLFFVQGGAPTAALLVVLLVAIRNGLPVSEPST